MQCGSPRDLLPAPSGSADSDSAEFPYPVRRRGDSGGPVHLLVVGFLSRVAIPPLQILQAALKSALPPLPSRVLCPQAFAGQFRAFAHEFPNTSALSRPAALASQAAFRLPRQCHSRVPSSVSRIRVWLRQGASSS